MLRGEVSQRRGWRCWRGGTLHASTSLCLRRLLHVIAGPLPAVCALCQLPHEHSLPGGCTSPPGLVICYAYTPIHMTTAIALASLMDVVAAVGLYFIYHEVFLNRQNVQFGQKIQWWWCSGGKFYSLITKCIMYVQRVQIPMTNDDFQNNSLLWQIYQNYQASTNNTWCYIKVDWMGWDGWISGWGEV